MPNPESLDDIQELTLEMMSAFHNGLSWIVEYCKKYNLPMPDLDTAISLINTSSHVLEYSEFTNLWVTGRRSTDKVPEPF